MSENERVIVYLVGKLSVPKKEFEEWQHFFESNWYLSFTDEDINILSASFGPQSDLDLEGQVVIYTGDYPNGRRE